MMDLENRTAGLWDQIAGNWKQLRGEVRKQWGKLTDDDWDQVAGERDKFIGKLQERYGIAEAEAMRQVDEWESRLKL
jgi:uncharacterized protein YjbJ (UPF0337 family)